jgi:hypothetical protein
MDHLRPSFFYDLDVVKQVGKRTEEETHGHFIMIHNTDQDCHLALAALLDGTTIDFLFGVRRTEVRSAAARANEAKKFMRSLDEDGQRAVAKFYFVIYKSVLTYQKKLHNPCSCLWYHSLVTNMHDDIDDAYVSLRGMISDRNIISDEQ